MYITHIKYNNVGIQWSIEEHRNSLSYVKEPLLYTPIWAWWDWMFWPGIIQMGMDQSYSTATCFLVVYVYAISINIL